MNSDHSGFEQRCEGLIAKHRKLAQGFKVRVGNDGLITVVPKRDHAWTRIRIVVAMIFGFFLFKSAAMALIPPQTYLARIEGLAGGSMFDRASAWLMQPDPVTQAMLSVLNWMTMA